MYCINTGNKILPYSNYHDGLNFMTMCVFKRLPKISKSIKFTEKSIVCDDENFYPDYIIFCTGFLKSSAPNILNENYRKKRVITANTTIENGIPNAMKNAEYNGNKIKYEIYNEPLKLFLMRFHYLIIINIISKIFPTIVKMFYIKSLYQIKQKIIPIKTKRSITYRKDNFILYHNKLLDSDIDDLKYNLIDDGNMVNYYKFKKVIDRIMKKHFSEYYWEKMRISCKSSNNIDSSKLHRDVISNNYGITPNMFYTIVIYLQDSIFGYIPYSNHSLDIEQKEKIINVSKNDIIMFDSTTLHRGHFKNKKRTCIQIFNVVHKTKIDYCKLIINSVLSKNIVEKVIYNSFFQMFDFSNRLIFNPRSNGTNYLILMIEGGSSRTTKDIDKQNLYYMNNEFPRTIDTIRSNLKKLYRFL